MRLISMNLVIWNQLIRKFHKINHEYQLTEINVKATCNNKFIPIATAYIVDQILIELDVTIKINATNYTCCIK